MPDLVKLNIIETSKDAICDAQRVYLKVGGNRSMHPLLQEGDILEVKRTDAKDIRFGDVIVFRHSSAELVAHGVVKIKGCDGREIFITKADVSNTYDEPVAWQDVLGRVTAVKRGSRHVRLDNGSFLAKRMAFVLLLMLRRSTHYLIPRFAREQIRHRFLGGILRRAQGFSFYRRIMSAIYKNKVGYRLAGPSDAYPIARLHSIYCWPTPLETVKESMQEYLKADSENPRLCFVAQAGNKIIGTIGIRKLPQLASVWRAENLFVQWRYRRIGIGLELAKLAMKVIIENDAFKLTGGFFKKDAPAFSRLFEKSGVLQYYSVSYGQWDGKSAGETGRQLVLMSLTKKDQDKRNGGIQD